MLANATCRLLNQFEHLAETYFTGFEFDLGERELGYAQNLDNDLDMFLASIASTKSSLEIIKQDGGNINSIPLGLRIKSHASFH